MRHPTADPWLNPWDGRTLDQVPHGDDGFSLIELIMVCIILPIVMGGISLALVSVLSLHTGVSARVSDSADAQTVSANFEQDIESAANITTDPSASVTPACGTAPRLLGLDWGYNAQTQSYQFVVSYIAQQTGTTWSLVREFCNNSSTPTSSSTISTNISATQAPPTIQGGQAGASTGWITTQGITGVTFSITEPETAIGASSYSYTLVGLPGASSSSSLSTVTAPSTSCGFAAPGTGTYASTLCFVDFTPWNTWVNNSSSWTNSTNATLCPNSNSISPPPLYMSAAITNTPYAISFCLSVQPGPPGNIVDAVAFPTYYNGATSFAFLGNNGFYTGVPGNPALYEQTQGSHTTVTLTNISVTDGNGNVATGWQFITGDAETTDSGESITWSANKTLNLLPDNPGGGQTNAIGNACTYSPAPSGTYYPGTYLTGVGQITNGTSTVECASSVSVDKTGTVMLEAAAPSTMTSLLWGTGLQAIFVGVLLP